MVTNDPKCGAHINTLSRMGNVLVGVKGPSADRAKNVVEGMRVPEKEPWIIHIVHVVIHSDLTVE
jgi:hypothetical protein